MGEMFAVGIHQHVAERRRFPRIDIQKIDIDRVALCDPILPTASLDNCVSHKGFQGEKAAQNHTDASVWQTEVVAAAEDSNSYNAEMMNTISPLGG